MKNIIAHYDAVTVKALLGNMLLCRNKLAADPNDSDKNRLTGLLSFWTERYNEEINYYEILK